MLIYVQAPKQLLLFATVIQTYLVSYQPPKLGENMIFHSSIYIKTSTAHTAFITQAHSVSYDDDDDDW